MSEQRPELAATAFLDHDDEAVGRFTEAAIAGCGGDRRERAVALYYAVRDKLRYEVYGADITKEGLCASAVIEAGFGFCIHKSIVYAAALRRIGVPSRLVFTDVRNHLASPRLRELVGGDVFRFHCITSLEIEGRWLKATPVFNRILCQLYRMAPLEFDGRSDSLHHPFDERGARHMEFLHHHGEFDDLPFELVSEGLRRAHPRLFADPARVQPGTLASEAPGAAAAG